jgi:hypothetical protein
LNGLHVLHLSRVGQGVHPLRLVNLLFAIDQDRFSLLFVQ